MEQHRLQWACRRGMLELDLILKDYLDNRAPTRDRAPTRGAPTDNFEELLGCTDAELADWLLTGVAAPENFKQIVNDIRKHANRII